MARLTRSQVAQRLSRSIATVRLLEQEATLVPTVGMNRRRLFDPDEVDALLARCKETGRFLSSEVCGRGQRHRIEDPFLSPAWQTRPIRTSREEQLNVAYAALRAGVAATLEQIIDSGSVKDSKLIDMLDELLAMIAEDPLGER